MPPFRYDDPGPNRYAGTILDLLRERGAIDASAAERIAGVRANADLQRGNAWAGAIRDVAALPGQIVAQRRAEADREQVRALNAQKLAAGEQELADRNMARDQAAYARGVEFLGATAKSAKTAEDFQQRIAQGARLVGIPENVARQMIEWSKLGPWEQVQPAMLQLAAQGAKPLELSKGEKAVNPVSGEVIGDNPEAPPLPTQASLAAAAAGGDATAAGALERLQAPTMASQAQAVKNAEETARHNAAMEKIALMGAGRAEAAQAETARHNRAMEENARNAKVGRPVLSGDANRIAEMTTSLNAADSIGSEVKDPGTLSQIQSAFPNWVNNLTGGWSDDAKAQNAVIALVRQIIGKGLEGGVLRKEDEIKYKDILPQLGETKELVKDKLKLLKQRIEDKRATLLDSLEDAGYDVSRYRERMASEPPPASDAMDTDLDPALAPLWSR